jgi:hypothetical protein
MVLTSDEKGRITNGESEDGTRLGPWLSKEWNRRDEWRAQWRTLYPRTSVCHVYYVIDFVFLFLFLLAVVVVVVVLVIWMWMRGFVSCCIGIGITLYASLKHLNFTPPSS